MLARENNGPNDIKFLDKSATENLFFKMLAQDKDLKMKFLKETQGDKGHAQDRRKNTDAHQKVRMEPQAPRQRQSHWRVAPR